MIVTADWHLREDRPICRLDEDWMETQRLCVRKVVDGANERDCDIFIIGDLFHRPVVAPRIVNMFLSEISRLDQDLECYILPGNHDVQYGNYENLNQSCLGIVINSGIRTIQLLKEKSPDYEDILFFHTLVFESEKSIPPNCAAIVANEMLKKYSEADWIFIGDNHKAFRYQNEKISNGILLNPGCLMRQNASEIDYKPGYWYVNGCNKQEIKFVESYDNELDKYITRNHLEKQEERDDRICAFVETLKGKSGISLDFESNINEKLKSVGDENIKELIMELLLNYGKELK